MNCDHNYLIDSDVLITAKNRYYAFPICPGFWNGILHGHSCRHLYSIDQVRKELLLGNDDLAQWVRQSVPAGFFLTSESDEIAAAYGEVIRWVTGHTQYRDEARTRFASGADGWLVAHGIVTGQTVVTNEQPRPKSHSVKLPDVCNRFGVKFEDTFAMLNKLGVKYHYQP